MKCQFRQQMNATCSSEAQISIAILKAIRELAQIYATAENAPIKYGKYKYDFPKMIRIKARSLCELNANNPWVSDISRSLLKSLDSPKEIQNICKQCLSELNQDNVAHVNQKEHAYV